MRKMFLLFIVLFGGSFLVNAQTAGDYQSHQTGNWSDVSSWERYDGSAWITPAPVSPTSTDGVISILGGHVITVDANTITDQVIVNVNGNLTVAATKALTIAEGADSVDMVVYGTLNNFGSVTSTGRTSFENGGLYIYSVPAGGDVALPLYTWRTGSTCRIDSTTGTTPTNLKNQSLYNLVWNGTNSGANGGPNFNDSTVISGDLTLLSTKSFQWRITNLSGGQTKRIYIHGNLNVNGSAVLLTSTGSGADTLAKAIVTIDGNVNVTAGTWSLVNSSAAYSEWRVKGNISITGGTLQSGTSGWAFRRTLTFNGGGAQSFTVTAPGTIGSASTHFKVSNNSTVQVNFPLQLAAAGALTLESGTFVTTSTNLITIPAAATIVGGSSSSYINGPLAMVVASTSLTAKFFPVGKGAAYRPVTLNVNQDAATATTYRAEVFNTTPPSRTLPAALSAVSPVRYYTITKGSGANLSPTLGATVQLSYDTDDLVPDSSLLRIAKDDGSGNWINLGGSGTASTIGSITSNAFLSFSDFVLATADTGTPAVLPTVTTTAMSYISTTFASSGGNVTNDGGAAVSVRGVCWNTGGTPTISDNATSDGTGAGAFTSLLGSLTPGLTYHVRAYATNSAGTGYGNEVTFSTLTSLVPPTVTTSSISNIQVLTAIGGGNVTDWGGDPVTARGVCWNTSGAPTIGGSHSVDGSGLGSFVSGLAILAGGTTYHVRAYATNGAGTGYGNEVIFSTQTPQPDTTVVVAQNGSGNYLTVQAAFRAVPSNYTGKWTIFVKKGVYYEKDTLVSGKINVVLVGEDRDSSIITYDDYADRQGPGVPGTSGSFTIAIDASDFTAKNITFRNTYSPQIGVTGTQAVALRTQGDRHEYINCKILGYQDTYYTWGGNGTGRMYHKNCFIEGTVDFIFGRNIVVFDSCTIHEIRNGGTLTAGATDVSSSYGYVFRNCTIIADTIGYDGVSITSIFLGRPWQASPRTVFLNTYESWNLNPAGWQVWNVTPGLYAEHNCFGPGSGTSSRILSSQLTGPAASVYSLSNIFARSSAASSLILYDWMPASAMSDPPLLFRLSASAGANGSLTPGGVTNVAYNAGRSYTITAAPGYHVLDVLVDGVSVGAVSSYNFTSVTANHTISASFAITTHTMTAAPDTLKFGNVVENSVATDSIRVVNTGIAALTIDSVRTSGGEFSGTFGSLTIAVSDSHTYFISFHPTTLGLQSGIVILYSNALSSPDTVRLAGIGISETVSLNIPVLNGWNMVSNPVTTTSDSVRQLFPASTFDFAFAFSPGAGYVSQYRLLHGIGYWEKFPSTTTQTVLGIPRTADTIVVSPGWNMIGSISRSIDTASIVSTPSGIVLSPYFGYSAGYTAAHTIDSGKAYWVKTSMAGSLVLSSSPVLARPASSVSRLDGLSSISITDVNGSRQDLYICFDEHRSFLRDAYELPPPAPEGAFDARFASQRMIEVCAGSGSFPISIRSAAYPVTVTYDLKGPDNGKFTFHDGVSEKTIAGSGSIVIANHEVSRVVISVQSKEVPTSFSLAQNFPNPFNPSTTIKVGLPVQSRLTLRVYNILGQQVTEIAAGIFEEGYHDFVWSGTTSTMIQLGAGVYFARLESSSLLDKRTYSEVRKMILLK